MDEKDAAWEAAQDSANALRAWFHKGKAAAGELTRQELQEYEELLKESRRALRQKMQVAALAQCDAHSPRKKNTPMAPVGSLPLMMCVQLDRTIDFIEELLRERQARTFHLDDGFRQMRISGKRRHATR